MHILAIESSCDETAVAVVRDGREVLSSCIHSQIEEHGKYGGVVPEIASRRHVENIVPLTRAALEQAELSASQIDAVAVTTAPGLIGALLVGVNYAKGLCFSLQKPLVPVHHLRGHIAANYIAHTELEPPFLCLVVSGGHSHIVEVLDYTSFRIVGKTRDDAAGEAFDKVARVLGLGYPGGVRIEQAAKGSDAHAFMLPHPKVDGAPYDFSFSGLKTAVINLVHNAQQKGTPVDYGAVAASFQHTVCDILAQRFFAAADALGHKTLACAGGVCANTLLRTRLSELAAQSNRKLYLPPISLCGDNAAMIGAQGYYEFLAGNTAGPALNAAPTMSIERSFS